jgi:hypothetical protein
VPLPDRHAPATVPEIARAIGFTPRGVRLRAEAGKLGVPISSKPYLFALATLPEEVRVKVTSRRRERERELVAAATSVSPLGPVFHVPLREFTDEEQAVGRQRSNFVTEVDMMRCERYDWSVERIVESIRHREEMAARRRGGDEKTVLKYPALLCGGKNFGCQLTVKNYSNWSARWKPWRLGPLDTSSWWCLCDRYRGQEYHRPGDPKFWVLLAALYETPTERNLRQCIELAREQSLKAGVLGGNLPTEKQVRYFYAEHADRAGVEGRRGGKKHVYDKISVFVIRDWRRVAPDTCWSGDHHNLRIACRTYDTSVGGWRFVTPWLTNWLDNSSWFETGWHISSEPNRDTIELALRKAVEARGGAPGILYFDNGKDYASVFTSAKLGYDADRAASLCDSLGCRGLFALPHNPRAKVNERDYRITDERFERLWPSYMGHNKAHLDQLWTFAHPSDGITLRHRLAKFPERHPQAGCLVNWELLPTVDEVRLAYAKWRAESRHTMVSHGRILAGQTPEQRYHGGETKLRPMAREEIALAFLRVVGGQLQRVARGGMLSLRPPGGKRADDIFYRAAALMAHVGDRVQRRVDISFTPPRLFAFEAVDIERNGEDRTTWKLIPCDGPGGSVPNVLEVEAFTDGQEELRRAIRATRQHEKNIRKGAESQEALRNAQRGVELAAGIRADNAPAPGRAGNEYRLGAPRQFVPQTARKAQEIEMKQAVAAARKSVPADLTAAYRGEGE